MRLPDYHTHTALCGHASGRSVDYVEAARKKGLSGIGIADHLPLLPEPDPGLSMSAGDLAGYVTEVEALKARFPGYVFLGIEADYRPQTISEVGSILASYPFDYVIGSVHHLGNWGFDNPREIARYAEHDIDEVWAEYFDLVGDAAESRLFTILGHLDLVKKFGYRPTRTLEFELTRLVDRIARAGALVEINTSGLYRAVGEAYPTLDILGRLCEAGVGITFGSDAHRPDEVGRDFDHAAELAQAAGYREYAILDGDRDGGRAQIRFQPFARPPAGPVGSSGEAPEAPRA